MYYGLAMTSVSDICEAVGRKKIERSLGVSRAAISNAVSEGKFPPGWYGVMRKLCKQARVECPMDLFKFRAPADARPDGSPRQHHPAA